MCIWVQWKIEDQNKLFWSFEKGSLEFGPIRLRTWREISVEKKVKTRRKPDKLSQRAANAANRTLDTPDLNDTKNISNINLILQFFWTQQWTVKNTTMIRFTHRCIFTKFKLELLQQFAKSKFHFQQSQSHANTISRSGTKRLKNHRVNLAHICHSENINQWTINWAGIAPKSNRNYIFNHQVASARRQ